GDGFAPFDADSAGFGAYHGCGEFDPVSRAVIAKHRDGELRKQWQRQCRLQEGPAGAHVPDARRAADARARRDADARATAPANAPAMLHVGESRRLDRGDLPAVRYLGARCVHGLTLIVSRPMPRAIRRTAKHMRETTEAR